MATGEFVKELLENDDFKNMLKSMNEETVKVIKESLDNHTSRIEEMEKKLLKRIAEIDKEHKANMEDMKKKLNEMDKTQRYRMQTIEKQVHKMEETHTRRLEQAEAEIHTLSCENIKLRTQNATHENQIDDLLANLEERSSVLEDQMQYSRRNCLIVTGIAENRGEDTDKVMQSFAMDKLGIQLPESEIDRSHRLGKKQIGKPRPIIIKFVRYNMRRKFMKERRKLKGQGMSIQEHLTPFAEHLYGTAQDLARKAPWLKKVWTWDGRITCLVQMNDNSPEQKITVKNYEGLNKIWRKGAEEKAKSPKRRTTDPTYEQTAWEKVEKRD